MKARLIPAVALGVVVGAAPALAQPGQGCSKDALRIGRTSLDVVLCVAPGSVRRKSDTKAMNVSVSETLSANGARFTRTVPLEFMDDTEATRTIDDVSLQQLGIPKALHLTIAYRFGGVRLEHAMLVPDAIGLK